MQIVVTGSQSFIDNVLLCLLAPPATPSLVSIQRPATSLTFASLDFHATKFRAGCTVPVRSSWFVPHQHRQ